MVEGIGEGRRGTVKPSSHMTLNICGQPSWGLPLIGKDEKKETDDALFIDLSLSNHRKVNGVLGSWMGRMNLLVQASPNHSLTLLKTTVPRRRQSHSRIRFCISHFKIFPGYLYDAFNMLSRHGATEKLRVYRGAIGKS